MNGVLSIVCAHWSCLRRPVPIQSTSHRRWFRIASSTRLINARLSEMAEYIDVDGQWAHTAFTSGYVVCWSRTSIRSAAAAHLPIWYNTIHIRLCVCVRANFFNNTSRSSVKCNRLHNMCVLACEYWPLAESNKYRPWQAIIISSGISKEQMKETRRGGRLRMGTRREMPKYNYLNSWLSTDDAFRDRIRRRPTETYFLILDDPGQQRRLMAALNE